MSNVRNRAKHQAYSSGVVCRRPADDLHRHLGPLGVAIVQFVTEHCRPTADGWRRKLERYLADLLARPKQPGEAITVDDWNALVASVALCGRPIEADAPPNKVQNRVRINETRDE